MDLVVCENSPWQIRERCDNGTLAVDWRLVTFDTISSYQMFEKIKTADNSFYWCILYKNIQTRVWLYARNVKFTCTVCTCSIKNVQNVNKISTSSVNLTQLQIARSVTDTHNTTDYCDSRHQSHDKSVRLVNTAAILAGSLH